MDFASLSAEGSEEWMVAVDTSGQLHMRQGNLLHLLSPWGGWWGIAINFFQCGDNSGHYFPEA